MFWKREDCENSLECHRDPCPCELCRPKAPKVEVKLRTVTVFAVRAEIMLELLRDPAWAKRWQEAKTLPDKQWVVEEFALAKGYKVAEVPLK